MNKKYLNICVLGLLPILASCAPVVVASSAIVGTTIAEERTAGERMDDTIITLKIKEDFTQKEFNEMLSRISVTAHEGRILLTGSVKDNIYKIEAEKMAWKVQGVREVLNEIEEGKKDFPDYAVDTVIANTIRSKILFQPEVKSVNYHVDVNDGVVFLLGISQNQQELDAVVNTAGSVKGVSRVVNYVIPKDDPRRIRNAMYQPKQS